MGSRLHASCWPSSPLHMLRLLLTPFFCAATLYPPSLLPVCLPGWGDLTNGKCLVCDTGLFKARFGVETCGHCPDGMIANSAFGATACIPVGDDCPAGMEPVNNLRSCGCFPGSSHKAPTNDVFRYPENADGSTNIWFNVRANQTFQTPVRMPNPSILTPFPVGGCEDCTGNTASSLNRPDLAGAFECRQCPANSRPNLAGEGGVTTVRSNAACVCLPGYEPNGANSPQCVAAGFPCATPPISGLAGSGGCVRPGQQTVPPPGTIPTPTPAPSNGDNNDQEWGHWHQKKHHKHSHKEESEYYSSEKEYDSEDKE